MYPTVQSTSDQTCGISLVFAHSRRDEGVLVVKINLGLIEDLVARGAEFARTICKLFMPV